MPPPLRKMPALAAAATECRLSVQRSIMNPNDPATGPYCSVRLHGDLVLTYVLRAVGGQPPGRVVCHDPPQSFDKVFYIYDPAFFRSYHTCSALIHQMLAQTPVVGDFDLADHNWEDSYLPHSLADGIVSSFWSAKDRNMGVDPRCNVDVSMTLRVRAVYSEPRALLRACQLVTEVRRRRAAGSVKKTDMPASSECCVCLEDVASPKESSDGTVTLPCSHVFHSSCLLPWFHRVSTCPTCRRDMTRFLVAVTRTPRGRFPGLEARVITP